MNKFHNENGFLTEEGKKYLENHFDMHVKILLAHSVEEQEINVYANILAKRVGDLVSEHKANIKESKARILEEIKNKSL